MTTDNDVTLRDLAAEDLDTLVRWRNDSGINRYLAYRVKTIPDAVAWFAHITTAPGNMLKAILCNGDLIGYCIVESVDGQNRKCEVGIIIGDSRYWGRGIGKIVVREILRHCFETIGMHRVLAVIARENERSRRLFASMGFNHEGTLRESTLIGGVYTDLECYSMLESEYRQ